MHEWWNVQLLDRPDNTTPGPEHEETEIRRFDNCHSVVKLMKPSSGVAIWDRISLLAVDDGRQRPWAMTEKKKRTTYCRDYCSVQRLIWEKRNGSYPECQGHLST